MRKLKDESGQALVMLAGSMIVLLGLVGFATDVGILLREQRIMQTAADAAAVGAASEALNENNTASVTNAMCTSAVIDAQLASNDPGSLGYYNPGDATGGASNCTGASGTGTTMTVSSSDGSTLTLNVGNSIGISGYSIGGNVQAIASKPSTTIFMAAVGAILGQSYKNITVSTTAIASDTIASNGCFWAVDDGSLVTSDNTLDMGGHSLITGPGNTTTCGVTVNGNIVNGGSSTINADFVVASGTVPSGNGWTGDTGVTQPDPLARLLQNSVPTASGGACSLPTGTDPNMKCIYDQNGDGSSCASSSTCSLSGTLTDNAVYYYDKPLNMGNGASVTGTGTGGDMIYLAATNDPYLNFKNGNMNIDPPAPYPSTAVDCKDPKNTNPFCGVLLDAPQDGSDDNGTYTCRPGAGNNNTNAGEIYLDFGSSTTNLYGVMYAPYMQLFVQDQGASVDLHTDVVIGNFCAESGTLTLSALTADQSPVTRVGLVY